jgi:hypothetical protein
MLLSIKERILLLNLLPQESNFTTLKIIRKAEDDLGFSEEDVKKYKVTVKDGKINWEGGEDKNIDVGEKLNSIITESLKRLDESKKLTKDHLSLCEKFLI